MTAYNYSGSSCNSSFPTSVTVGSLTTTYVYDCTGAVVKSATDPNSATTSTAYSDPYFWRPASSQDALGYQTYFSYYTFPSTGWAGVEAAMIFNGTSSTSDRLTILDGLGRTSLSQTLEYPGASNWDTVEYLYNSSGQLAWVTQPFPDTKGYVPGSSPATGYAYDALGRYTEVRTTNGSTNLSWTDFTYNLNQTTVVANPAPAPNTHSPSSQYQYDGLGRLTSVCEMLPNIGTPNCTSGSVANAYLTTYSYNSLGSLLGVNQSGQIRSFTYDGLSRMLTESNPESGTTTYTYDSIGGTNCSGAGSTSAGDLVARNDSASSPNYLCYHYDGYHRLTAVGNSNQSASNPCRRFAYDSATPPTGITLSNPLGRMIEAKTDSCILGGGDQTLTDEWFAYNAAGQPTDLWETTPSFLATGYYHVAETYFANGARNTVQGLLPSGSFADLYTYNVDGKGRPYSMKDGSTVLWGSTTYNSADQPLVVNAGGTEAFTYDPNSGRMATWTSTSSVLGQVQQGTLTWNPDGTLETLLLVDSATPTPGETCSYSYDDVLRLKSVGCGSGHWGQTFSYDAMANISKTATGSPGTSFLALYGTTPSPHNQVTNLGFTYDVDGNVKVDNLGNAYAYDFYGRVNSVLGTFSLALTNDAFGRTVEWTGPTQAVYAPDGQKFAFMQNSTLVRYIDSMVAGMARVQNGDGTSYFQHADWLGSSWLGIHGYDGTLAYLRHYAPFGETDTSTETSSTNRNFTGQTQDSSLEIYDFPFRQQSTSQGRWLSPDPAGIAAVDMTNPQTWNRYAYVANNPLNAVDPLGLFVYPCLGINLDCSWSLGASPSQDVEPGTGQTQDPGADPGNTSGSDSNKTSCDWVCHFFGGTFSGTWAQNDVNDWIFQQAWQQQKLCNDPKNCDNGAEDSYTSWQLQVDRLSDFLPLNQNPNAQSAIWEAQYISDLPQTQMKIPKASGSGFDLKTIYATGAPLPQSNPFYTRANLPKSSSACRASYEQIIKQCGGYPSGAEQQSCTERAKAYLTSCIMRSLGG